MHIPYQASTRHIPCIYQAYYAYVTCSSAWTCISSPMTHISPQPCPALHDTIISCVAKGGVVRSRPTQSPPAHTHTRTTNTTRPPWPRRTLNASKSPKAPSVSRSRWEIGSSSDRCRGRRRGGRELVSLVRGQSAAAYLAQLCAEGRHVEVGQASGDVLGNVSLEHSRVLSEERRAAQVRGREWAISCGARKARTGRAGGWAAVCGWQLTRPACSPRPRRTRGSAAS